MSESKLYKHLRACREFGLVETAAACEIVNVPRFCEPKEWQQLPPRKKENSVGRLRQSAGSATYAFDAVVMEADGRVCQGLKVAGHHTRCPRVTLEKTVFTLFKMEESGEQCRVVQVEVSFPLPAVGPSSLAWPHVHFGRNRDDLPMASDEPPWGMKKIAAEFERHANVKFEPAVSDPEAFELEP